ncbi:MAG: sodium-dependent transporter, partial [Arcobacteraceae bacterium]
TTAAILMPIGGIFIAIFVGYVMDKEQLRNRLVPFMGEKLYRIWLVMIRYVAPIAVLIIMLNETGIVKFE